MIQQDKNSATVRLTISQQPSLIASEIYSEIRAVISNKHTPVTRQSLCSLEFDTLSQGQLLGEVDGASGTPHVLLPSIRSCRGRS